MINKQTKKDAKGEKGQESSVRIKDIIGVVEVANGNELDIDVNKMEIERDYSLEYQGSVYYVRRIDRDVIKIYEIDNKPSGWS